LIKSYKENNKLAKNNKRVVVAMSGGVDSSVVAGLLKEQGYEVIGITLRLYDIKERTPNSKTCCAGQDIYDAKKVATQLGIAHYVLDYKSSFENSVVKDFVKTYRNGATPIPCVICNQKIKFSELLNTAKGLNANYLATGHYIDLRKNSNGLGLYRAIDNEKDQSYFLFQTKKKDLNFLKFPLGKLTKKDTRELADKYNISVANKPESQDICFIPDGNYRNFLKKYEGFGKKGEILTTKGEVVGEHFGLENYTIGQRKHLNLNMQEPRYVVKIIKEDNILVVGSKNDLIGCQVRIREFNWLGPDEKNLKTDSLNNILIKVRARQKPVRGKLIINNNNSAEAELIEPTSSIAKGQGCVFYSNSGQLLGGGWIT
tara:strand:- start:56 stop:1171 length:1116 start_codon:yes stop_codon:yes gene_type:complete